MDGSARTRDRSAPQSTPRLPVLLVHGWRDSAAQWRRLRARLQAAGMPEGHAIDLAPANGSIGLERLSEQVARAAEALCDRHGVSQIDIVAFSMGALTTRCFIQLQGGHAKVRRFISISGPHHGTLYARLLPGRGMRDMRPGSQLLKRLDRDLRENGWRGVEVHSLYTPVDLTIMPPVSSRLAHAHNRQVRVPLHALMPMADATIEDVLSSLRATP